MRRNNPWYSYRQVAAETASPGYLVLMLFDGTLSFLDRALNGFDQEDPVVFNQTINYNVQRAQAIIHELDASLNMTAGGEFARNQRRLYDYLDRRLQESNLQKDQAGIREVIQRLTVLRNAWAEMLKTRTETQVQQPLACAYA